jgi:hypothetical protein
MERIFVDFVGPLVRSRKGNIAMLVILDGFSKFVSIYPVRRISSDVVKNFLAEKLFFLVWSSTIHCFGQCNRLQIPNILQLVLFLGNSAHHHLTVLSPGIKSRALQPQLESGFHDLS